ncbi:acid phosphatase [Rhizorhabdus argentea]|uniref:acid phosphatase n=1 Tax=Rhizorhabdus argentea TaxID=1387174 RepID=UPI0030EED260
MKSFHKGLAAALLGTAGITIAAVPDGAAFLAPGFLSLIDVVPPAPIVQEPRGVADQEIFKLTRALKGSPRWDMATADIATDTASMMHGFACAARVDITPQNAPRTAALLEKASRDAVREASELKSYYKKKPPFLLDSGETCTPPPQGLDYGYPSDFAARGWTWGLILGEAVDDRAAPILARARAYGESRIVCGLASMSAVDAGRMVASATLAVVRTEPGYATAMVAARAELAALRKTGTAPSAQSCSAEEALVSQPIFR